MLGSTGRMSQWRWPWHCWLCCVTAAPILWGPPALLCSFPVKRDVQENDEEAVQVKEQSILELGSLLAKTGQAEGEGGLGALVLGAAFSACGVCAGIRGVWGTKDLLERGLLYQAFSRAGGGGGEGELLGFDETFRWLGQGWWGRRHSVLCQEHFCTAVLRSPSCASVLPPVQSWGGS